MNINLFFLSVLLANISYAAPAIYYYQPQTNSNEGLFLFAAAYPFVALVLFLIGLVGYINCWVTFFKRGGFFTLVGLVLPAWGAIVGLYNLWANHFYQKNFGTYTDEQIVDYIDKSSCESLIANSNPWLKNNWHPMNDCQKIEWIKARRQLINEYLPKAQNASEFIQALQQADKEYSRSVKAA